MVTAKDHNGDLPHLHAPDVYAMQDGNKKGFGYRIGLMIAYWVIMVVTFVLARTAWDVSTWVLDMVEIWL